MDLVPRPFQEHLHSRSPFFSFFNNEVMHLSDANSCFGNEVTISALPISETKLRRFR